MRERPILFSAPMVRAILEGRKTQTRRICKLQPPGDVLWGASNNGEWSFLDAADFDEPHVIRCPCGIVGDRLWVRETWSPDHERFYPHHRAVFRADDRGRADTARRECRGYALSDRVLRRAHEPLEGCACEFRWRPSIHMPRWASRITLEVTGVRVERLQDITDNDIIAEGVGGDLREDERGAFEALALRERWRSLWESINGAGSWATNPWTWVVEFKVVTP